MRLLACAALTLASGCALAPGMQMDRDAARGRPPLAIERITQATVQRLVAAHFTPTPLKDPLADESAHYRYTIAPHDVLQVTVWDHPELTVPTGQFRSPEENGNPVEEDGTMFYPHVGLLDVAGKTVAEVRNIITTRLTRVIPNPQVDVRVAAFRGKKVAVTGEVTAPSTVPITDVPLHVQDALAAAKGFTPEADFSRVSLARAGKTYVLNLQSLYESGDLTQNWLLQDGDVINVPDRSLNKVFVLGEVRVPQSKLMVRGRMTLAEALIDQTQGFDPSAANVSQIFVIRGDYESPHIFQLDASSPDALLLATQFPLRPRDVVFVSTYNLTRYNRVILQILPTIQGIWQTYDLVNRITR
ncbi:polysaccharide export protein [Anaeromyxobacter oryzae]|uniref:Exopolysaccharide biosynthesis protein BceE n=1 Tax=Anaeromyxobacter oryzae TaxID=2918170 RepID=A0ABN6MMX1_9BACT|nr:polysaccharide export protein [Anaeromyxobacter oryzae]BDG02300.1 exopolysaccharide biosynthesis protein BceE [Anaeromyxobacter oryzae]